MRDDNPYELYSDYERLDEATEHIRTMIALAAQKVSMTAGFLRCEPTMSMLERAFGELVEPVLVRHRNGGACDTEPYYHAYHELRKLTGLEF